MTRIQTRDRSQPGPGSPLEDAGAPISNPALGPIRLIAFAGGDVSSGHAGDFAACLALRRTVFIDEQGVPESLEWDGLDPDAHHFLALRPGVASDPAIADTHAAHATPLGTARMRIVDGRAKAERVVVVREARKLGIGRLLMLALEDHARRLGLTSAVLHAQLTAIPFYERLGYRAHGEVFPSAGIDHRKMTKSLG